MKNNLYDKSTNKINLSHFPKEVRDFLEQGTKSVGCPDSYFPTLFLALASVSIGTSAYVRVKNDWKEFPSLYTIIIGEPGLRKTPSYKAVFEVLKLIQKENKAQAIEEQREYDQLDSEEKKGVHPPKHVLAYLSDTTIEALIVALHNNPLSVLILNDEIAAFINSFNIYRSGGGDRQAILSLYNNTQILVYRKSNPIPLQVDDPFGSIAGGIQIDPLKKMFSGENDGFFDRVIFAFPEQKVVRGFSGYEIESNVIQSFHELVYRIYRESEQYVKTGGKDSYVLSEEAKSLWVQWQEELPTTKQLAPICEKAIARCIRFSLILEVFINPNRQRHIISKESMHGAIHLSNFYLHDYNKLLDFMVDDEEKDKAEKALHWIAERSENPKFVKSIGNETGISFRKFRDNGVANVQNTAEALGLWEILEHQGHGHIKSDGKNPHPSRIFVLKKD